MKVTPRIMANVLLATATLVSLGAQAEYVAYSVDGDQRTPLPENIDGIDAKDLLNVEWGSYGGRKARVGVLEVDNNSSSSSFVVSGALGTTINYSSAETGVPVNGIEAIIVDILNRTGRYRLVEREQKALQSVLTEQDLGASVELPSRRRLRLARYWVLSTWYKLSSPATNRIRVERT